MPRGDNSRKLSDDQIIDLKNRISKGICMSLLARKFNISRQRVHQYKRQGKPVKLLSECEESSKLIGDVGFI